jgi:hypothetical protein
LKISRTSGFTNTFDSPMRSKLIVICLSLVIIVFSTSIALFDASTTKELYTVGESEQNRPEMLWYLRWNQTYGGTSNDEGGALIHTADGGFAMAGGTWSFGAGGSDMWLVKTDANGVAQWNQTYGGTDIDYASDLVQTADGGFVIAGYTMSSGAGGSDMWLVKTDANGVILWNQTFGGTSNDEGGALIQTTDGGFVIVGETSSFGTGGDVWLIKTDRNGTMQWNQTYGGMDSDWGVDLINTTDGGYIILGSKTVGVGDTDMWLVKMDENGVVQWNQTYGGKMRDLALALIRTMDNGIAITGRTSSFGAGLHDMWLVKTDENGIVQWDQTYGGTKDDWSRALIQTKDGGFALVGITWSFGAGWDDIWLVKTNASGVAQGDQTYGGASSDMGRALIQTTDGDVVLVGSTNAFGAGGTDMWLMKTEIPTETRLSATQTAQTIPGMGILPFIAVVIVCTTWYRQKK